MSVTRVAYTVEGWGEGELWVAGDRLVWHELPRPRPERTRSERPGRRTHSHPINGRGRPRHPLRSTIAANGAHGGNEPGPNVRRLLHKVERYFAGECVEFDDVEIDLAGLTDFQRAIVAGLRRVRYGDVVSYAELARSAGYPNAQRAAGTFCAHNRYALVLPCHRIVAANGIGSYGSLGVEFKRRLLELEGVAL